MKKSFLLFIIGMALAQMVVAQTRPLVLKQGVTNGLECKVWVDRQMEGMTLKEKIGQLFIHTIAPHNTPENRRALERIIKEYKIGGLLFSGGELANQVQLTNLAQKVSEVPLFITFDGEWGLAMRLKNTTNFPRNRVLGCIQDEQLLYEYGKEVARQCREIGVQINFAPVADVDVNPRNPVINTRSFGGDPQNVARKVIAYSRGLEEGGVLSVSKHFPGHGDTEVDSHKALPVLTFDRARLDSIELYPFRETVKAGVSGVMVGHLEVPHLGKHPASISSEVIDVLTEELGFEGLVFTDALEMKGISQNANVSARALMAGNDLLLVPRNLKRELDGVLVAVKAGKLTEEEITEKCRKVLAYKYALGLRNKPFIQLSGLEQRLNTPEAEDLLFRLYKAAVTVPLHKDGVLPLDEKQQKTVVLSIGKTASSGQAFFNRLKTYLPATCIVATPEMAASIKGQLQKAHRVIVTVTSTDFRKYKTLLTSLPADLPVIYVYLTPLRNMTELEPYWRKASAVVLGHTDAANVQSHIADVIVGKEKADGRLSVAVGGLLKPGEGVTLGLGSETPREYKPGDYAMNPQILSKIDEIAQEGIGAKAYPGCQILILKDGIPVYNKAFGTFTYESDRKVEKTDIYDIASLTKTTATLLAVMKLYDEGRFGLTDRIARYVPALKGTDKERITIEELLFHQSGLPAYWPFYRAAIDKESFTGALFKAKRDAQHRRRVDTRLYVHNDFKYKADLMASTRSEEFPLQVADSMYMHRSFRDTVLVQIADVTLKDRRYRYSCLNFMLLKEMVENLTGQPIDEYLDKTFYVPMGMTRTAYLPLRRFPKEEIVPTVKSDYLRRDATLQGYVHDELAAFIGGVSGNAGLFSNAIDVAKVYQMILNEGVYEGQRYLSQETCNLFMNRTSKVSRRGLGFDKPDKRNPDRSPCAEEAPKEVFGHTGFTGTCAWVDPVNRLVFVFLSNRVYPRPFDHKVLMRLNIRPRIQQVMYQALEK